ncbi:unnamed protein product [Auanema sp. JU1783]|nr:unnamed protein product [Auanema sp. JU1783]
MAPPTFADLGKSAKDLINKGYNFGFVKIDSTSRAGEGKEVEFKTAAAHNLGSGKFGGNLDVKYKIPQYGVVLTEKWNTENQLGTVVEINEKFGRGLKLTFDSLYAPQTGKRSGKLKADWSHPTARLTADVALTSTPVINAAGVFSKDGFLLGAQASFDTSSNKLASTALAFGFQSKEYTINSFVVNTSDFGASVYHKIAHNVEIGAALGWKLGGDGANFDLGTKYSPSRDLTLRAKVNNKNIAAVAATHNLSDAMKLTLSSQFNLAANEAHKFGLGIEFEPSH